MRIELPAVRKFVHEARLPIRWGEMDVMGHVNNAAYFRYIETVRIDWASSLGAGPDPKGQGIVIVNAFCSFHQQLEWPGEIRVRLYVSDVGRTSFETWAEIERADDPGVVYASGGGTTVWVDFPAGKAVPIPDWFRSHLE